MRRNESMRGLYIQGVSLPSARALGWFNVPMYEDAARKFPNVQSCLVADRARAAALEVDWSRTRSAVEAEVCISRVAAKVRTVDRLVDWLRASGFSIVAVRPAADGDTHVNALLRSGRVIEAHWSMRKNGPMYRKGFVDSVTHRLIGREVAVTIFTADSGGAVSVNCAVNVL